MYILVAFKSYKSPTSVLVTSSGKFLAFGYKAEQMYGDAIEEDEEGDSGKSRDMLLFRHFKMMLHNKEVCNKCSIKSFGNSDHRLAVNKYFVLRSELKYTCCD